MTKLDWERERRRDPRTDPTADLLADQRKLTFIERLHGRPMSIAAEAIRLAERDAVISEADEIQLQLDYDLELCRWAADALPTGERAMFWKQAERDHADCSSWLVIKTGEAFSIDPPKRHRIGRAS